MSHGINGFLAGTEAEVLKAHVGWVHGFGGIGREQRDVCDPDGKQSCTGVDVYRCEVAPAEPHVA